MTQNKGQSAASIYKESNPNVTYGTARTESYRMLTNPRVKRVIDDISQEILTKYGFTQFCDSLTNIVHTDPDNKNKIAASKTMLQAVGAFNQTKKELKINLNLDIKDMNEFSNTFEE